MALEQAAPAERWKPPSNTTGVHVHVVVVGLGHGVHRELHVTVPVGAWTCLDLRKVCCQRWDVPLHSTDRTHWRWVGNRGTLEDAKRLEEANAWQRGDNKIYVSRVISAAPAEHEEQQQAAPAEQQQQVAVAEQQAVVAEQQAAVAEQQAAVAEQQAAVAEQQAAAAEQQAAPAEHQVALEQAAPAERWKPPSNTTGVHVHVVVVGLGHGVHRELHVTVPVGAWTCLDLRKVCCQRWDVPLHSTDRTHWRWVGNRGTLEDAKRLEEANAWQRGDNKIYVSRVIRAAPAEHVVPSLYCRRGHQTARGPASDARGKGRCDECGDEVGLHDVIVFCVVKAEDEHDDCNYYCCKSCTLRLSSEEVEEAKEVCLHNEHVTTHPHITGPSPCSTHVYR